MTPTEEKLLKRIEALELQTRNLANTVQKLTSLLDKKWYVRLVKNNQIVHASYFKEDCYEFMANNFPSWELRENGSQYIAPDNNSLHVDAVISWEAPEVVDAMVDEQRRNTAA